MNAGEFGGSFSRIADKRLMEKIWHTTDITISQLCAEGSYFSLKKQWRYPLCILHKESLKFIEKFSVKIVDFWQISWGGGLLILWKRFDIITLCDEAQLHH
ncbi:MAG: hypothetical protein LUE25_05955, partial [Clostridiales bacterium]|nr:hypothetical protein [Clostridiales bacterium]